MHHASVYIGVLDSLDVWRRRNAMGRWPDVNQMLLEVERIMLARIYEAIIEQWHREESRQQ